MQDLNVNNTPTASPLNKKKRLRKISSRVPIDMLLQIQVPSDLVDEEVLKKRLRKQLTCCDINEVTTSGLTALNQCALDGNLDSTKILIELGARVNKKDRFGWTALHYAASEGYVEICRLLLRKGANLRAENKEGQFPVEVTDEQVIVRLLLRATMLFNLPPLEQDARKHSLWKGGTLPEDQDWNSRVVRLDRVQMRRSLRQQHWLLYKTGV